MAEFVAPGPFPSILLKIVGRVFFQTCFFHSSELKSMGGENGGLLFLSSSLSFFISSLAVSIPQNKKEVILPSSAIE